MKVIDLARAYAEHMDGWRAEPTPEDQADRDRCAYLVHDGERVRLLLERPWDKEGRLTIRPEFPWCPDGGGPRAVSVGVSIHRGPAAIARDIMRRSVPAAIEGTRRWEQLVVAREARQVRAAALRAEMVAQCPDLQPWGIDDDLNFDWRPQGDTDSGQSGSIKLRTRYRFDSTAGSAKADGYQGDVQLHGLTLDQVKRVVHALSGAPLWLLAVEHRHGRDESVHASEEDARNTLHAYVEEWWDREVRDAPIPPDRDRAIDAYFEAVDNEFHSITELPVP